MGSNPIFSAKEAHLTISWGAFCYAYNLKMDIKWPLLNENGQMLYNAFEQLSMLRIFWIRPSEVMI